VAAVGSCTVLLGRYLSSTTDVYLGYLPLAHVLEFAVENFVVFKGIPIGYGTPRTLTDQSVRECLGDIRTLRPTLMAGVPAVWEGIRKAVMGKLKQAGPVANFIFKVAFELKWHLFQWGLPTFITDKLVFDKLKANLGGRLRFALSGGAPISQDTQKFLTVAFCPILQGQYCQFYF
jgi:long-chain acyl-CoA synthetase